MSVPLLEVIVTGTPRPQGSVTPMVSRKGKRYVKYTDTIVSWRTTLQEAIHTGLPTGWVPLDACAVTLSFAFPRPKAHYRANGQLKPTAPLVLTNGADIDKLSRACLDGLVAGGALADDRHVTGLWAGKHYAGSQGALAQPGVRIEIWSLDQTARVA